jgi:calcineurin-like phosphoesterase family protein
MILTGNTDRDKENVNRFKTKSKNEFSRQRLDADALLLLIHHPPPWRSRAAFKFYFFIH